MNFRYQCLSCDYFTSTKCNILRHNKSTLHLRLCKEIEEEKDLFTCKCGKRCKTRQSFSYHKKNCESIILPLFKERILKNKIDLSLLLFLYIIVNEEYSYYVLLYCILYL